MKALIIVLMVLNTNVATSNSTRKLLKQLNDKEIIVVLNNGQH